MDIFLLTELCTVLNTNITQLDLEVSFIQNGGDSLKAVALAAACKSGGRQVSREAILTCQSLREILEGAQMPTSVSIAIPAQQTGLDSSSTTLAVSPSIPHIRDSIPPETMVSSIGITNVGYNEHENLSLASSTTSNDEERSILTGSFSHANLSHGTRNTTPAPADSISLQDAEAESLTEFQLSLIHGTLKSPGTNVIIHSETFYSDHIPLIKNAWKTVIEMEPIFQSPALVEFYGEEWKLFDWRAGNGEPNPSPDAASSSIGCFFEVFPRQSEVGKRDRSTVVWTVHHALIDGYSASLVFDKVRKAANGMKVERGPSFSQVVKDLKLFQQTHRELGNAFWQDKLQKNDTAKSEFLLPPPLTQSAETLSAEITIDISAFQESIFSKACEINVTPASFFNAAWALVLASYADSDTVVFGAVLSGRTVPLPNVLAAVGPLVSTLPLFVAIQRSSSIEEYVRSVFHSLVELESFQWTTPVNGFSRQYESALALQFSVPTSSEYFIVALESRWSQPDTEIPVTISIHPDGKIQFKYHRSRYSGKNMERVVGCFYEALQCLLRTHATVDAAMESLLSCPSQALLKRYGNCFSGLTTRNSIKEDLVTLHEKAARDFPDNNAVEKGDSSITYKDFDHAASQLALHLTHLITPGDVVCVHSDRSINWLVAIFGILKAGGVYCSLDSGLPPELRSSMYKLSDAKAFLTPSTTQLTLAPTSCENAISVEEFLKGINGSGDNILEHRKEPEPWRTAYLIFTSGSTGVPKGVSCTHAGLVAFQSDLEVRLFAQPGKKISQIMSAAFDGSIHELFSALTYGATLVLPSSAEPFDHLSLVDSAILTPSIARVLNPQEYKRLKTVSPSCHLAQKSG
jgi:gliotoxin/aspirochlorine biosynthesis peptide synthetase